MKREGYIVITTVLIVSLIIVLVSIGLLNTTITEGKLYLSDTNSTQSKNILKTCIDESLIYLSRQENLPTEITVNGNNCNLDLESNIDDQWTYIVSVNFEDYLHSTRIVAQRSDRVYILSWEEIK